MALTADRKLDRLATVPRTPEFGGVVAAGYALWRGSIAAVCADGTLVPAGATGTPSAPVGVLGLAEHQQINTPNFPGMGQFVGGATPVKCEKGAWALPFDVAPSWANLNAPVYAVDDQTVSLTQTPEGASARLLVGTLIGFDLGGTPYVEIG
ncbi:MAG: hypothetical protein ABF479_17425 [Gluconacetobacter sp.]